MKSSKTTTKNKRKIWQMPWGFPESITIVCGIVVVGSMLQLLLRGGFNFYLLAAPVNYYIGGGLILTCIGLSLLKKNRFIKWFSGIPFSISLIMAFLLLSLIMGLTPQLTGEQTNTGTIFSQLGFDQMTHSWAFVLIYLTMLLALGVLIAQRLQNFKWKDYTFHAYHIGIWLVLFSTGLGHADMERYIMHVPEGETEWRVYDASKNVKELPIAIQLNDFDMETYPPQLTIIDRHSGAPQPKAKPDFYSIDSENSSGMLNGWQLKLEKYIHQAIRNSDSTYREMPMPGATPAAHISMYNPSTGVKHSGWVCGGNQAQLYMTLPLTEHLSVVMSQAEPKRFRSDVILYTPNGTPKKAIIEVNKPAQVNNWMVYQYGYNNQAGQLSKYSSMELVYDPWKTAVYIGFGLIALGTIAMIWNGKQIKHKYTNDKQPLEI
ncbi:cytochrome c biogenesis protein ResB [Flavobacterium sp. CAU 1735]|uniref:cytochrome c biogenesis protein ResB n=1 Tax=Flavobacterium sp. CAU 1735 TaxID=3140361 RepID=UPI0032601060